MPPNPQIKVSVDYICEKNNERREIKLVCLSQVQTGIPEVPNWTAATITGTHGAAESVNEAWRGQQNEAPRGFQTEIVMRVIERSTPETRPTTEGEDMESGIAETTEREVGIMAEEQSELKPWENLKSQVADGH